MHGNLLPDSGMKDAQPEEEAAAEEKDAGDEDPCHVSGKEGGNVLEDNGEDEAQHDNSSPEDHFHLAEEKKTD